jgi:hypothetical protein
MPSNRRTHTTSHNVHAPLYRHASTKKTPGGSKCATRLFLVSDVMEVQTGVASIEHGSFSGRAVAPAKPAGSFAVANTGLATASPLPNRLDEV